MRKLSEKDIRALKLLAICAPAILVFYFGSGWLENWSKLRAQINSKEAQLKSLNMSDAKRAGLTSIVPAFEMPEREEAQKNRFRDKLVEQLKKAGIKYEPLKVTTTKKTIYKSYKLLLIQAKAKCNFTQMLDFLSRLNENPHLVGIEAFKFNCDKSKPQEVEFDFTVSTAYL